MAKLNFQIRLMEQARGRASFDSKKMAEIIYGSKDTVDRHNAAFRRIEELLGTNDNLKLPPTYGDMNRQELFLEGLRAGKITFEDGIDHNCDRFHNVNHIGVLGNSNPYGLTHTLFIPFVKLQGTDEQIAHWVPLAESGRIIGSYTQTELAHGTFVGGIETTATLDKETDEFIIHSPTLTSIKYWPGAIGFASSHTILMARMIIDGKDLGIHAFVLQLRSLDDFKPMPGIELGDIGLKMSYNGTDNGYAVFDRVRIPRTNLLMRHCKVTRDGSYFSSPLRQKLMFGGLLNGRSIIIRCAVFQLAQALTITTRYSTVRQQGSPSALGNEKAIIHYKHQHFRLLSLIARCYITILAWKSANASHAELKARRENGDHSTLPYIHMLMCGLKAWSTQTAADGAEEARKMCGGHGYIIISGLSEIVTSVTATCTLEGENFVMWNQVARYMLKGFGALPVPKDMAYMDCYDFSYQHQACGAKGEQFLDHNVLLEIFKRRAARLAHEVHDQVKASESSSKSRLEAENIHGLQLLVTGRAHIEVFLLSESMTQLAMLPASIPTSIKTVLHRLVSLFALTTIANPIAQFSSSFLGDGYLTNSHLNEMRQQIDILLEALLPDAIALTDAWCFSDASLASAIGCADGDVYTRLLAWTRQLPINVQAKKDGEVFKRGWEEYIKPFLNRDLSHLEVKAKL